MTEAASTPEDESLARNYHTSLDSYEQWLAEEPTNSFALHHMGMLIEEEKRTPEGLASAEDLYRKAIAANDNNVDALVSLASLLSKDGKRKAEAKALFEKGMGSTFGPTRPRLYKNYAILLKDDASTAEEAKGLFMQCSELDKHNASVYITLAEMHEKSDPQLAKRYLDLASHSDPDNNLCHSKLGNYYEKQEEYNSAAEYYRNAIKLDRHQFKQWFQLGRVYETIFAKSFCKKFPSESKQQKSHGKQMTAVDLYFDAYCTEKVEPIPKEQIQAIHGFTYLIQAMTCYKKGMEVAREQKVLERTGALKNRMKAVRKRFPWIDEEPQADISNLMQIQPSRTRTFNISGDISVSPTLSGQTESEGELYPCLSTPVSGMRCIRGHPMKRVSHKPPTYSRLATWACEECHLSIGGIERSKYGAFYCPICKYDLCYACSLKPRSSHFYADPPREIGQGGMGKIMRVFDPYRGTYSAVKVVYNAKKAVLEREVQAMVKCKDPNVVTVFKDNPLESQGDGLSFAMELMAGSLQDVLNDGPVHENIARQWICDSLCALVSLKRNGIFHRDIKPANILLSMTNAFCEQKCDTAANSSPTTEEYPPLTSSGTLDLERMKLESITVTARRVKLADFGICTEADVALHFPTMGTRPQGGTRHTRFAGTDFYASPESQDTLDPKVNHKSDVYSLGQAWYVLLTGSTAPIKHDESGNISLPFSATEDAKVILRKMTAKNPADRPTAEDVLSWPYFKHVQKARSDKRPPGTHSLEYVFSKSNEGIESLEDFNHRKGLWKAAGAAGNDHGALTDHTVVGGVLTEGGGTDTDSWRSLSDSSESSSYESSEDDDEDIASKSGHTRSSTGKRSHNSTSGTRSDVASEEVKALRRRVAELEARVAELELENSELKSRK